MLFKYNIVDNGGPLSKKNLRTTELVVNSYSTLRTVLDFQVNIKLCSQPI